MGGGERRGGSVSGSSKRGTEIERGGRDALVDTLVGVLLEVLERVLRYVAHPRPAGPSVGEEMYQVGSGRQGTRNLSSGGQPCKFSISRYVTHTCVASALAPSP